MREIFCRSLEKHSARADFVFLTGDLGFRALEPLRDAMGSRFLNAGVAEQNMVCVAAGLAKMSMRPWAYSIAPFLYARPFEQIRNNICLPDLPVVLAANGGGYGYGVMGSTHHALEDYGAMLTLANMRVFVPAFDSDVEAVVDILMTFPHPAYLRLGVSELPGGYAAPGYAPWRRLITGGGPTMLVAGPVAGGILSAVADLEDTNRPSVWLLSELPLSDVPPEFLADLRRSGHLFVVEEHVAQGGLGHAVAHHLLSIAEPVKRFTHRTACGYLSGLYGSQAFHRRESQLDSASILEALAKDDVRRNEAAFSC